MFSYLIYEPSYIPLSVRDSFNSSVSQVNLLGYDLYELYYVDTQLGEDHDACYAESHQADVQCLLKFC
jgi:hypothetical protein